MTRPLGRPPLYPLRTMALGEMVRIPCAEGRECMKQESVHSRLCTMRRQGFDRTFRTTTEPGAVVLTRTG